MADRTRGHGLTVAERLGPDAGRLDNYGDGTYRPIALALAQAALTVVDVETADALASAAVDWSRRAGTPVFLGRALVLAAATRGRDVGEAVVIADRTGAGVIRQDAARLGLS